MLVGFSVLAAAQPPPGALLAVPSPAAAATPWAQRLAVDLPAIDARHKADIGLYLIDLHSGATFSYRADRPWYIASMVKVPVALAVLRGVDAGAFTLETTLRLRAADYVDGGGMTNSHPLASALSVGYLLEQMMVRSDNTASDMLIGLVGASAVNALVAGLVPQGFGRITTLAEVRRQVYGQLTPAAQHLSGAELMELHRLPTDRARLALLAQFVDVPVADFRRRSLDAAYNAYYASGLNSARLDAYGSLLAQLVQGQALAPESTRYLLDLMARSATGAHRIKAGLAAGTRFAHKTGTQRRVACDAGLLQSGDPASGRGVIVVACTRGEIALPLAEAALRDIGNALCRSRLLNPNPLGALDDPSCDLALRLEHSPAAATAADRPAGPLR